MIHITVLCSTRACIVPWYWTFVCREIFYCFNTHGSTYQLEGQDIFKNLLSNNFYSCVVSKQLIIYIVIHIVSRDNVMRPLNVCIAVHCEVSSFSLVWAWIIFTASPQMEKWLVHFSFKYYKLPYGLKFSRVKILRILQILSGLKNFNLKIFGPFKDAS